MSKLPISAQLYTVRDDAAKDFVGTLKKIAEIGFAGVELAGFNGLSLQELKSTLDDNGLTVSGSHVSIDRFETEIDKVIDENLALGNRYVVVPFIGPDRRGGVDAYKKLADQLAGFAETVRTGGLTVAYHNHDFEFQPLENGEFGMDIILQNTDPQLVKAEVDTYWVLKSGNDPVEFINKYRGRVPLLHIKDMDPNDQSFAEVGTGTLPLDAIVAAAPGAGTEWLIIEQDVCKRPPLESLTISYNNMKAKGYA